jgi:hypothetical protein
MKRVHLLLDIGRLLETWDEFVSFLKSGQFSTSLATVSISILRGFVSKLE